MSQSDDGFMVSDDTEATTLTSLLDDQEEPIAAPPPPTPGPRPKLKTRFKASELDLMEIPELLYIIPGLLPAGLSLLVAKPKAGKSWLSMNLSASVARGDQFFGQELDSGEVLYLVLEDNHQRLRGRLKQMLDDGPLPEGLEFWTEAPKISPKLTKQFEDWIARSPNPRLIIIDPLVRVTPQKRTGASDYEAATEALATLQRLALDHNLAILIVHHAKKGLSEGNDVFDLTLGSTGINGVMDAMLVLQRERDDYTADLHVTGRDIEERKLTIVFDPERGVWSLEAHDILERVPSEQLEILKALFAGHAAPKDIVKATGKGSKNIYNMLKKLNDKGFVRKVRTGEYALTPAAKQALEGRDLGGSGDRMGISTVQEAVPGLTQKNDSAVSWCDPGEHVEDENDDAMYDVPEVLF